MLCMHLLDVNSIVVVFFVVVLFAVFFIVVVLFVVFFVFAVLFVLFLSVVFFVVVFLFVVFFVVVDETNLGETENVVNASAGCQSVLPQSLSTSNRRNNPMKKYVFSTSNRSKIPMKTIFFCSWALAKLDNYCFLLQNALYL